MSGRSQQSKDLRDIVQPDRMKFAIPDFTSIECQIIGTQVLNKISHILSYIKEESKKLS